MYRSLNFILQAIGSYLKLGNDYFSSYMGNGLMRRDGKFGDYLGGYSSNLSKEEEVFWQVEWNEFVD